MSWKGGIDGDDGQWEEVSTGCAYERRVSPMVCPL